MAPRTTRDRVLAAYEQLEPGEADSWISVGSRFQMGYRLNMFFALTRALEHLAAPMEDLQVVDLGCGTGRSTRLYLDVGLEPAQITGLDLRAGTIGRCRKLNPAIKAAVYDGGDLPRGHNWLSASTLFSSVSGHDNRQQITASLPPGGYVFYYDHRTTIREAGYETINPRALFRGLDLLWTQPLGRFSAFPARDLLRGLLATGLRGSMTAPSLRELISDVVAPSHEAMLLRKPG